ncbi:MAG: DegT/DnrJ/EryC1/StrS family aminotransferase [Alphaproteobacteria bacterium]|nr:DegT/DnrJ/EryC1/StrS family aminotransferase [Alphaproteobacteria bacterium]
MEPIAFVDLQAQYRRLKPAIDERIARVLAHGQFILGPEVRELEERLAAFAGCRHAITVSSGTDALLMPLMAYGIGSGDAVFVPTFTFGATAEVVVQVGATPIFVDVEADSCCLDVADLARCIAGARARGLRPAAVIPVDLYGQPADYAPIQRLADAEGVRIIADGAQSYGGSLGGRRVGSLAPVTAVSFFPAKPLGCYGDGGALFTDDAALAEVLRSIRVHGAGPAKYELVRVGINGRLDTIQAAVLLVKLDAFAAELERREAVAQQYHRLLGNHVAVPRCRPAATSAWACYTIQVEDRDRVKSRLQAAGIPSMVYYPRPMHLQVAYRGYGAGAGSLPVAERLSARVLSLPIHADLDADTVARIAAGVVAATRS